MSSLVPSMNVKIEVPESDIFFCLECPVCLGTYNYDAYPLKFAACGHHVCNGCLCLLGDVVDGSFQRVMISCPMCRIVGHIADMREDWTLLEITKIIKQEESSFTKMMKAEHSSGGAGTKLAFNEKDGLHEKLVHDSRLWSLLKCPKCTEIFGEDRHPMELTSCGHHLCIQCTGEMASDVEVAHIICAVCQSDTSTDELKIDRTILEIATRLTASSEEYDKAKKIKEQEDRKQQERGHIRNIFLVAIRFFARLLSCCKST